LARILSQQHISITCFNCTLRREEKENNFIIKIINHIKEKIEVPHEQGMDDDDDDDI
jgi:hypothetical protein